MPVHYMTLSQHICDRCKTMATGSVTEGNLPDYWTFLKIPFLQDYYLCEDCSDDFDDFMKEIKDDES